MEQDLNKLKKEFIAKIALAKTHAALEQVYYEYLGRKGSVTAVLRSVKDMPEADRPRAGKLANRIREELEQAYAKIVSKVDSKKSATEKKHAFDPTVPARMQPLGHLHPITIIRYQLEDIFRQMGFMVVDGPEIESDYYNFTSLNIPADHPARDMQDTFWLTDGNLLRTHVSAVQVRALQKYGAPFRGIFPGRVFRYEATDAAHENTFYQMDGMVIDKDISIAHLIAFMQTLLQGIFQIVVDVRLRPGYFPFVEPGFELDIKCLICEGSGCPVCKKTGWLELMPCGLVHPEVLRAGNIDPNEFSGLAFDVGLSRLAMMKYGISDIRLLQSGDVRFLNQF